VSGFEIRFYLMRWRDHKRSAPEIV